MGTILGASYYQLKYCLRNKLRQAAHDPDFLYQHYVGKPFYDTDALNQYTANLIESGKPFMMGRFGAVELFNMRVTEFHLENKKAKACEQLFTCAGFFPNDTSLLPRFNDVMKDACRQTDILGLWQNACEDYYIRKYCKDLSATCRLISLEPWRSNHPWSAALAGKKVLVVHPFEESIQTQYRYFDKLFPGKDILPEFELKTLKAVQTAGSAVDHG